VPSFAGKDGSNAAVEMAARRAYKRTATGDKESLLELERKRHMNQGAPSDLPRRRGQRPSVVPHATDALMPSLLMD